MASEAGKSGKVLKRSARFKQKNSVERPRRVRQARERHLKNATRSCGIKFAEALRKYYATIPVPGPKAG